MYRTWCEQTIAIVNAIVNEKQIVIPINITDLDIVRCVWRVCDTRVCVLLYKPRVC